RLRDPARRGHRQRRQLRGAAAPGPVRRHGLQRGERLFPARVRGTGRGCVHAGERARCRADRRLQGADARSRGDPLVRRHAGRAQRRRRPVPGLGHAGTAAASGQLRPCRVDQPARQPVLRRLRRLPARRARPRGPGRSSAGARLLPARSGAGTGVLRRRVRRGGRVMSLLERLKAAAADDWSAYVDHAFVRGLGDGSLPAAAFRQYLVQDYLFLIQFARAHALAACKARTLADMRAAKDGLAAIVDVEMQLHLRLCERWGLSPADVEATPEHAATVAYTRWVLDIGMSGDLLDLQVALTPCTLGYAEIGRTLAPRGVGALDDAHPYREWIGEYSGP